jgi:iron-sulfur cluster repair protein YtfE (RIC family)
MMLHHTHVDSGSTVNEIVARHPETIVVFNQFGIDSCCGGGVPLRDAALRDGAELAALLRALDAALERP